MYVVLGIAPALVHTGVYPCTGINVYGGGTRVFYRTGINTLT